MLDTYQGAAYLYQSARGGAGGLSFMQGVYMDEARMGQGYVSQAAAWDDNFTPGLKRLANAIHEGRATASARNTNLVGADFGELRLRRAPLDVLGA
jgi:2,4-dienoyl-CoA reductase-like NADH-dependent reductase (Old Yellow Enzyme family)